MAAHPEYVDNVALQKQYSYIYELFFRTRYGTGKIVLRVFILLRQNELDET
jgi:hypothetical protein